MRTTMLNAALTALLLTGMSTPAPAREVAQIIPAGQVRGPHSIAADETHTARPVPSVNAVAGRLIAADMPAAPPRRTLLDLFLDKVVDNAGVIVGGTVGGVVGGMVGGPPGAVIGGIAGAAAAQAGWEYLKQPPTPTPRRMK